MFRMIVASVALAVATPVATPVLADPPPHAKAWGKRDKDMRRERRQRAERRDWSRPERYYVADDRYQPRRLRPDDQIFRGRDGRYYCRRKDGTTGLIIGGLAGGVLGNLIAPGGSKTVGSLAGGALGAVIGKSLDDGVTCR